MSPTGRNANIFQPVETKLSNQKLSTSYFVFHREFALQPISYSTKMFVAEVLVAEMSMAKMLMVKVPRTHFKM